MRLGCKNKVFGNFNETLVYGKQGQKKQGGVKKETP
jgi:hypothetical protein